MTKKIGIIGAGSWGTSLAITLERAGNEILVWARDAEIVESINNNRRNPSYLSEHALSDKIIATANMADLLVCDYILITTPSKTLRIIVEGLVKLELAPSVPIVICSKGVEEKSLKLLVDVVKELMTEQVLAVLTGPNFADEIAANLPSASLIATENEALGAIMAKDFSSKNFRCYYSKDLIGAQVCGAAKNVLAIATGIAFGKVLGENAAAAIITRGIAEVKALAQKLGGNPETLLGLAGIGDIVLTCKSPKSRNMSFGIEIAQGKAADDIIHNNNKTVEGYYNAKTITNLAAKVGVEMPICQAVYNILYENRDVTSEISKLLSREITAE